MKLQELIVKLQAIEQKHPGTNISFQVAENIGNGFQTMPQVLLDVRGYHQQGEAIITIGNFDSDIKAYQEYLEAVARRSPLN